MYEYQAEVLKVLDGDTIEVSLDLGLGIRYRTPLRLFGINAPEVHSHDPAEKAAGAKAQAFLEAQLDGKVVLARTVKPKDKYGRYLATVFTVDRHTLGENINDLMVSNGHAKPYDGGQREPFQR